jgi:transcriptional regulator of acetoin/glycerol metabolism
MRVGRFGWEPYLLDVRSVFAARDALLSDGSVPVKFRSRVRPAILESWHRSVASGASMSLPVKELNDQWRSRTALRRAANPILSGLAEGLADLETGLLLADHNAVVLRRWIPDHSIVALLDSVNSDIGYNVAEELVGTNGVGTVIETGRATQITGPEHLSTILSTFTCVGAPIHHPLTRRIEGVITLTCLSDVSNPLLTPLLTSTAREIEHRLLEQASSRERLLLDAYLKAARTRRAPIAAVGRDIFFAGPKVTELLHGVDHAMLWEYVRAAASGSHADQAEFGLVADQLHIALCEPIESDGQVVGTIVEFTVDRPETRRQPSGTAPHGSIDLLGKSASIAEVALHAARLAASDTSVLIEGEGGVGKLTMAEAIIDSAGAEAARVDIAALEPFGATATIQTLRRELDRRPEILLIRHVESLTAETAAAIASLLEEFAAADRAPRIIATLTTDVDRPAGPGFQRLLDLIAVGRLIIPPLRDRREDISVAASAFFVAHRAERSTTISSAALRVLMRAPWPGNLRQLDRTIEGLVSGTSKSEIGPDDLPADLRAYASRRELSPIEELELNAILNALQQHHGNKYAAANAIGISRSTLYRKLRTYHVNPDRMYF